MVSEKLVSGLSYGKKMRTNVTDRQTDDRGFAINVRDYWPTFRHGGFAINVRDYWPTFRHGGYAINVRDRRQTDGIAIAYSERNVVTFAKNL